MDTVTVMIPCHGTAWDVVFCYALYSMTVRAKGRSLGSEVVIHSLSVLRSNPDDGGGLLKPAPS